MIDALVPFAMTFVNAILIAFIGYLAAFILYKVLQNVLAKPLGKTWALFIARLAWLGVMVFTFKIILDQTGATGLVVVLVTALTGALAIGSEGLAADLVAGLILFFTKPFEVDDYIAVGDFEGTVVSISTTFTHLDCYDGTRIVVRNSVILNNTIIDYSTNPGLRIETIVPVPLNQDLEKAVEVLYAAVETFEPQARTSWFKPHVNMYTTGYGYAEFKIRFFIPPDESFGVQRMRMFIHAMKALKAAGISTKA
jgi:small conductance mechanosensitive channel